jgi:chitinase
VWDEHHKAPYMFKEKRWVSYDNEESIRKKSQFAYDHKLAGVMTWSIDTDDFRGMCGGPKFPLLRTINYALYQSERGLGGSAPRSAGRASVTAIVASVIASAIFARL